LPLVWTIFIQTNQAWTSVWGTENGDVRTYQLLRERRDLSGKLLDTMDDSLIQYIILNETDIDIIPDGYSDLKIGFNDLSNIPVTFSVQTLNAISWLAIDLQARAAIFDQLHDSTLLESISTGVTLLSSLVLPVTSYFLIIFYYGINWTLALDQINTTYTGYTGYHYGSYALIEYDATDQMDSTLSAMYNETGTIRWDLTTGWLQSLEYKQTYEAPLDFSILTKIKPYSQTSAGTFAISIKDIFGWLGLAVGIVGLCFTLVIYKKIKPPEYRWVVDD
ncbi:MAG TPA: hypothetical protein VMV49_07380, partial [Candidatus Deferrimicrobium sp.]|nr:hypothetical protein [Candidatus Deferrimicrobium sp.]